MRKIRQLLNNKGHRVFSISKDSTVWDALDLMTRKGIGSLIVRDGEQIVGIFTERDYARKVGMLNKLTKEIRVSDVMTENLVTITPDHTVNECMVLNDRKACSTLARA